MSGEHISSDQDFMVSLQIGSAPILTSPSQNQGDIQASYWKGIVPKDDLEIASIRPWILVHTASHSTPVYEQQGRFGMRGNGHLGYEKTPSQDKGSFCGWDKPLSFIQLELSPAYLERITLERGISWHKPPDAQVSHTRDPKILQVSRWLLDELMGGSEPGDIYVESLVNLLALQILLRSSLPVDSQPPYDPSPLVSHQDVARAIEYMRAHFSQDISLDDLSQIAHVSPSQLGRLFKRYTNVTPHQYLILLRVAHARELLHSGLRPISKIASQSGFVDQSHLNRHFKRIYGVTPKTILSGR